jgi:hypothetical protein
MTAPARIKSEGCLDCGGGVHVLPEGVLCQDCEKLAPLAAYRSLFAIKAGYENMPIKDTAPQ